MRQSSDVIDRRARLLDAAIQVIGTKGLAAVTHRSVQETAGVPHGAVTYYFGTRNDLVVAAVERLAELDEKRLIDLMHQLMLVLARRSPQPDYDSLQQALVEWIESDPIHQIARYEVLLEGTRNPAVRTAVSSGAAAMWRAVRPIAVAAGSDDPDHDARIIVALLDGLIFDRFTRAPDDLTPLRHGLERVLNTWHP
ncbi:TetR family transcriptional regulator [Nocardia sp. NPDC046763]|uniref:TetR/AcrR family transcriptional regulator n=1 Tax=Nocardia sp. NPDC046763 TaxID=3155256 RepID=UPI0033D6C81D